MKTIGLEELKSLQLDILKRIDLFCKENEIHYSLAFGTLLGAVRHHGYIPWDDDIDIMMLREDYERFVATFQDTYTRVIDYNNNSLYNLPFAKVIDNRTVLKEDSTIKAEMGIYVDVFPVDNMPDDETACNIFYQRKKILNLIHDVKILTFSRHRSIWKNLILAFGKLFFCSIDCHQLTLRIAKFSQRYKDSDCHRVAVFATTDNKKRWIVEKSIFNSFINISFEGRYYSILSEYDKFLTAIYGDYMKLPPIEQRVSHHVFEAYRK